MTVPASKRTKAKSEYANQARIVNRPNVCWPVTSGVSTSWDCG